MTFYYISGIVCVVCSVILVGVYILANRYEENSKTARIIMWVGMLMGVAGAVLLTIEYSFPRISHPHIKTVEEHFIEKFDYTPYITYDEIINVHYQELNTVKGETEDTTYFLTTVIYSKETNNYLSALYSSYTYDFEFKTETIETMEVSYYVS